MSSPVKSSWNAWFVGGTYLIELNENARLSFWILVLEFG